VTNVQILDEDRDRDGNKHLEILLGYESLKYLKALSRLCRSKNST